MSELFDGVERVLVEDDLASVTAGKRREYFKRIDSRPERDFYLLTRDPAKLAEMWPPAVTNLSVAKQMKDSGTWKGERHRENIIIGVPCKTQAEADRLIPELLKLSGLCRGLWADTRGQTEEIDINVGRWIQPHPGMCTIREIEEWERNRIHFVTCGGLDTPVHPQWLRTIRDQCVAAGVALWFAGYGEWMSETIAGTRANMEDLAPNQRVAMGDGKTNHIRFTKVGSARSGHLLDGVEWRMVLTREGVGYACRSLRNSSSR